MNKEYDKKTVPPNKTAGHPLSGEERAKILETALYRMVMIDGMVYGLEDDLGGVTYITVAILILMYFLE